MEIDAETVNYLHVQHYSTPGNPSVRRLEPVITRSMGVRRIRDLRFALKTRYTDDDLSSTIRYQIHAANYEAVVAVVPACLAMDASLQVKVVGGHISERIPAPQRLDCFQSRQALAVQNKCPGHSLAAWTLHAPG
jgi:hypothetical protein